MRSACNRYVRRLSVFAVVAVIAGCGDSASEPEPTIRISDLVGSWTASSVMFTNQANASQQFDIVAAGGELRVTVLQGGGARHWLTLGTFEDEWDSLYTLSDGQLTVTPAEASRPTRHYSVELSGSQLTLRSTDANFDFTLTGASGVSAREVTILVRR